MPSWKTVLSNLALGTLLYPLLANADAAGKFIFRQCECDDYSVARSFGVNFIRPDGKDVGVSVNSNCFANNDLRACTAWVFFNQCIDTGFRGVGKVCYNQEAFHSDRFGVNGKTYNKNDYPHTPTKNIWHTEICESLCTNIKRAESPQDMGGAYEFTITGFPEPHAF